MSILFLKAKIIIIIKYSTLEIIFRGFGDNSLYWHRKMYSFDIAQSRKENGFDIIDE